MHHQTQALYFTDEDSVAQTDEGNKLATILLDHILANLFWKPNHAFPNAVPTLSY